MQETRVYVQNAKHSFFHHQTMITMCLWLVKLECVWYVYNTTHRSNVLNFYSRNLKLCQRQNFKAAFLSLILTEIRSENFKYYSYHWVVVIVHPVSVEFSAVWIQFSVVSLKLFRKHLPSYEIALHIWDVVHHKVIIKKT